MHEQTVSLNGRQWQVFLRAEADQSVLAEIFKLREYRAAEPIIKNATHPIIDIGAHSGLFSLYVRALNQTVPIFAVEPEPKNLSLLAKHLAKNSVSGVTVVPAAIGNKNGKHALAVSLDSHDHHLLGKDETSESDTVVVGVMTIPTLLKKSNITRVSLIKMDIEGGEYDAFEKLAPEDFNRIGAIIMEYHNYNGRDYHELEKLLRENGFGVQVYPSKFDNRMGFIFARNKRK